jgi:hypothetical protein
MYNIEYLITGLKAGRSQNIYKSTCSLNRKLIFAVIYWKTRAMVSNHISSSYNLLFIIFLSIFLLYK